MWKTMKALVFGLCLFMAFSHGPASAQTTKTALPTGQWTSLGAGPLFLSTVGDAWYAVSGTTPSLVLEGFPVPHEGISVNTTLTVWARPASNNFASTAYTFPTVAGTFSGTFTWPGTAGLATGGTTSAGTMPYVQVYAPTDARFPMLNAPDLAATTGDITTADIVTTCALVVSVNQTDCTGTPTVGSVLSIPIAAAGSIAVSASLTGGTATFTLTMEISQNNTDWYGRGLFLDSNPAPIWKNNIINTPFSGLTSGAGVAYYRVRASTFATLTGTPVIHISIRQSNSQNPYVINLPTSAGGTSAAAAVNVQGETGGLPVITNQTQQNGVALGSPTAVGTQGTGNAPNVNSTIVGGTVTATFAPFAPNGNYATLSVGAISAQVGLPAGTAVAVYNIGSNAAFVNLGTSSAVTATSSDHQVAPGGFLCFAVGSNTNIAAIETAGTTNLNLGGGAGGCAGSGGGGGGSSSGGGTADANLTLSGTISAANVFGTGISVVNYIAGQGYSDGGADLTGTCTTNACMSTSGFAGWNSLYVECSAGGTAGTNWFEIDTSGGTGGTLQKRQATFTGPTYSGIINASGATFLNIMADQYASGTLACTVRGTQNFAAPFAGNGPIVGNLSAKFSANSATTAAVITGVPGLSIVVTSASNWTDGSASAAGSAQYIEGTGATCGTGSANVSEPLNFTANNGLNTPGSVGRQFTLKPGDSLCVTTTTANQVYGQLTYAMR